MRRHSVAFSLSLLGSLMSAAAQTPSPDSGQPAVSPSVPYQWSSVAMGGAGFVSGIVAHPAEKNLICARTDVGGAYRLNSADGSWIPLLDWLPPENASAMGVESLALDPRDPSKIYLLTGTPYWRGGTSILRSSDRGKTWQVIDVSAHIRAHGNKWGRHTGERLAVDPNAGNILFCGSRNNGLWRSTDSGKSWSMVESFLTGEFIQRKGAKQPEHPSTTGNGNGICFVVFDPASGRTGQATKGIFVGLSRPRSDTYQDAGGEIQPLPEGNLFHSTDGGLSWRALPPLPEVNDPKTPSNTSFHPCRALVAGGRLFVTFQTEKEWGGGVFRYDPASDSWADISPGRLTPGRDGAPANFSRTNDRYCGIDLVPSNPPRMLVSTFGTYQPQAVANGKTLWGEKIYLSPLGADEDGKSWIDLFGSRKALISPNIPFAQGQNIHWGASVALDPHQPDRAFISSGNGIWGTPDLLNSLTNDPGKTSSWKMAVKGLEESVPMDVVSIPGGPLVSVIWDYAGFTNDDPAVYSPHGMFRSCGGLNVRLAAVGNGRNAHVLRLNAGGGLCWSTDSGVTWTPLEKNNLPKAGTDAALALSADSTTILYTPSDRKVYRNHDPARQWPATGWKEVADLAGAHIPLADPLDPKRFYAYHGASGQILASNDGGSTFKPAGNVGHGANWRMQAAPGRSGDLWIPHHAQGITRWKDGNVSRIPLHRCSALGFGRGKSAADYPVVFIWGRPLKDDPEGLYRSTDQGKSWFRVNDDRHQYGDLANGGFVRGCMNVYGRVYRSTAGRGVVYGTPRR